MPMRAPSHSQERGRRLHDQSYAQQRKWVLERQVYGSTRWKRLRASVLRSQPWCADPFGWHKADGRLVLAREVDHIIPLRVQLELAYVVTNLQALCKRCHVHKTHRDRSTF